jgi:heme o synthase
MSLATVNSMPLQLAKQYYQLTKPGVVALIVFTAVVGMLLSTTKWVPWQNFIAGSIGIWLAAASAAALNHLIDRHADAQMARTQDRPLPQGHLSTQAVFIFALILAALSMMVLLVWVNSLTAILTFASMIGYAVIYTLYLKRATPQNIVIGGAAGAMPPVLGWVAITNDVHPHSLLLFLIIFIWTPPHFWALAVNKRDEYARVNIPMLPVTHGADFTRLQITLYTILLVIVTLLPYVVGMTALIYLVGVSILNGRFLYMVFKLQKTRDDQLAMRTFFFSITYLMLLFALLLIDHYLPYSLTFS